MKRILGFIGNLNMVFVGIAFILSSLLFFSLYSGSIFSPYEKIPATTIEAVILIFGITSSIVAAWYFGGGRKK